MKAAQKGSPRNKFKTAVESIPEVADGYRAGLQALSNADARKIKVANTGLLSGSVDIDKCTKDNYPEENRWDYALGYNDKAYFVEVHGATTSEIKTIISKAEWLKSWLRKTGKPLLEIQASNTLYWIATGKVAILPTSNYRRNLDRHKIRLVGTVLDIDKA